MASHLNLDRTKFNEIELHQTSSEISIENAFLKFDEIERALVKAFLQGKPLNIYQMKCRAIEKAILSQLPQYHTKAKFSEDVKPILDLLPSDISTPYPKEFEIRAYSIAKKFGIQLPSTGRIKTIVKNLKENGIIEEVRTADKKSKKIFHITNEFYHLYKQARANLHEKLNSKLITEKALTKLEMELYLDRGD